MSVLRRHGMLWCLHWLHFSLFFSAAPPTTHLYTLSLHDALPISTQAWASSIVPVPILTQMYGSVPRDRQYSMNSSVPNRLDSSVCQARSMRRGRCSTGPTPSVQ